MVRALVARTLDACNGRTQLSVLAVFKKGRRSQIHPVVIWLEDNAVASRQFEEPQAEQAMLFS
jgi:hypothetical protein